MRPRVLPRRDVLDDKGTMWEFRLLQAGWNDLPAEQRSGTVIAMYTDGTFDVHFEALNHTSLAVFPDELRLLKD